MYGMGGGGGVAKLSAVEITINTRVVELDIVKPFRDVEEAHGVFGRRSAVWTVRCRTQAPVLERRSCQEL